MSNTSATGGYLVPGLGGLLYGRGGYGRLGYGGGQAPQYDAALDSIFQGFIANLTGLDGTLVRPRWQPVVPIQPERDTNWCGVGVTNITKDAYPILKEVPNSTNDGYLALYIRHEAIEVLASFYGPQAQSYASMAEDGMYVGQNNDMLKPFEMAITRAEPIRSVPDFVNQQWIRRYDLAFSVKRKVVRTQQILTILSAEIDIIADCPPVITEVVQVVPA